jgi:NAD(P)-dependent dehydrogenase (short-subunit alcohol dehydrogenase family)
MDVRDLHGRWALVTGAASGIGRASALTFARGRGPRGRGRT